MFILCLCRGITFPAEQARVMSMSTVWEQLSRLTGRVTSAEAHTHTQFLRHLGTLAPQPVPRRPGPHVGRGVHDRLLIHLRVIQGSRERVYYTILWIWRRWRHSRSWCWVLYMEVPWWFIWFTCFLSESSQWPFLSPTQGERLAQWARRPLSVRVWEIASFSLSFFFFGLVVRRKSDRKRGTWPPHALTNSPLKRQYGVYFTQYTDTHHENHVMKTNW